MVASHNEIMEDAGWKTNKKLYEKGNKASDWADVHSDAEQYPTVLERF